MTTKAVAARWKGLELTNDSCVWVKFRGDWSVQGVRELTDDYFCLDGCAGAFFFDGTQDADCYQVGNVYEVISAWPLKGNSPTANYA